MSAAAIRAERRAHPAIETLESAMYVIDHSARKMPTAKVIELVRGHVVDAIQILLEPDPVISRALFILAAMVQATEVSVRSIRGKTITRVKVVDYDLYSWAVAQAHALPISQRKVR